MTPEEIKIELNKPFDNAELKFFPAATMNRDGKKMGKVATFADTRVYMERLDAVVPGAWSTRYRFLDPIEKAVECTLGIDYGHGFVYRSDVGYPNEAKDADDASKEPLKAAYSDALKRACVQHGIGRFIYSVELERDWLELDQYNRFTTAPRIKGSQAMRPPSTPARLQQPAGPDQLGKYRAPSGELNGTALLAELTRAGLTGEDLARIAPPAANSTKADVSGWLERNKDKTIDDLVQEVAKSRMAAVAS